MDPRRLRVMGAFALHAICVGGMFSRIAELQRDRGFDAATFGLVLTGIPCGVLAGTLVVSPLVERLGTRRLMLIAFPLFAVVPLLIAVTHGAAGFWAALAGYGLTLSLANVAINVEADRVALASGRPMMLRCHGTWGAGLLAATGLAALAIRAGIPPGAQFLAIMVLVWAATLLIVLPLSESPPRPHSRAGRPPRFALPDRGTLAVMGFALAGIVYEGVTRQWSIIYLRDSYAAADWIAALTLPAVVATQTTGRFMGDAVIARIGERALGRVLAGILLAGGILLVWGGSIGPALAGCLLIGLGISVSHPLAMTAVARSGHRPASESVAAFASLQTLVGFASPALFGSLAEAGGLSASFAALLPLPILAFVCARVLRPRQDVAAVA